MPAQVLPHPRLVAELAAVAEIIRLLKLSAAEMHPSTRLALMAEAHAELELALDRFEDERVTPCLN